MALKKIYATQDEIPEALREHYTEAEDGSFVLDLEGGLKSDQDVARLDKALKAEREAHRATKQRIQGFGDLTPEAVQELRDQVEDLTAQVEAGGTPDPTKLEPLIERRANAKLRPVERERDALKAERDRLAAEAQELKGAARRRSLQDTFRKAGTDPKGVKFRHPSVLEDVELMADRVFEQDESGAFVVKDGVGFTPGLSPVEWLKDVQAGGLRPHWFLENEGAGATGGEGKGGGQGANPLMGAKPNITEWSKIRAVDPAKAERFAVQAKMEHLIPKKRTAAA